jgi:isopentenyl phosphate kinase
MEAAAEAEESAEEKAAPTKTEDNTKLQNVIYSIYNNPEVLKALLRGRGSFFHSVAISV